MSHASPPTTARTKLDGSVEMNGSHEVMFTRPEELEDKIIEASFDGNAG
jgi:hypothetical protein